MKFTSTGAVEALPLDATLVPGDISDRDGDDPDTVMGDDLTPGTAGDVIIGPAGAAVDETGADGRMFGTT